MKDPFSLSVNYAYYENGPMLREHLQEWGRYSDTLKARIEFNVTDDCSSRAPAYEIVREAGVPDGVNLQMFRITKKVPWNYLAARNIDAHHSRGSWLLTTDMDLMLTAENAFRLLEHIDTDLSPDAYYRVERKIMPDETWYKPHPDTWLMTRKVYWKVGGNDEEFAGRYGGLDGVYKRRVIAACRGGGFNLSDVFLLYYPRGYLKESGTNDFARKEGRKKEDEVEFRRRSLEKMRRGEKPLVMSFPYERTR